MSIREKSENIYNFRVEVTNVSFFLIRFFILYLNVTLYLFFSLVEFGFRGWVGFRYSCGELSSGRLVGLGIKIDIVYVMCFFVCFFRGKFLF